MVRAMRNSGIPWIGEIPEEWGVIRHKYVMHKVKEICEHYGGEDVISLSMHGVRIRDLDAGGKMPTTFDGYQYVEPEDMLLCLFDIDVTPRCVGVVKNYGVTSPAYSRFVVHKGYLNRYFDYLLRFIDDEKVFVHLAKNLRSSLTEDDFGVIKTIAPSLEEQIEIASYLDRRCAEIDRVIAATQRTIEEYKKLKQSIITEAVTHGVRGPRKMKDSGVEWIGEIPEGWETAKLKTVITGLESGVSVNAAQYPAEADKIGVLRTSCVSKFRFIPTENKAVNEEEIHRVACPVKANTLIMSRMNTPDLVGACGYSDHDYPLLFLPDRLWQISFVDSTNVKYLWYYLNCNNIRSYYGSLAVGTSSSMQNISQDQLFNTVAVLPVREEQAEIVAFLDTCCAEIDRLIEAKQRLLAELEAYKKSVIYEYVTGKREVPA